MESDKGRNYQERRRRFRRRSVESSETIPLRASPKGRQERPCRVYLYLPLSTAEIDKITMTSDRKSRIAVNYHVVRIIVISVRDLRYYRNQCKGKAGHHGGCTPFFSSPLS